ncbi:hypothetical protein HMPREF9352_1958 [Streptococcus gallolyticus subsp. gallolyticus TX20005]|nr:hypothetical protein HMPREF9352_1958 [Streptococcus gallolyticus subsp. gallolyticus TX20005]
MVIDNFSIKIIENIITTLGKACQYSNYQTMIASIYFQNCYCCAKKTGKS